MTTYNFDKEGIEQMYAEVCSESMAVTAQQTRLLNAEQDDLVSTTLAALYEHLNIKITIGSHTISLPNNADFVEYVFGLMWNCLADKI